MNDSSSTTPSDAIDRAATLIADADAIIIGAGAGMGVDSGLPDFRGNHGFWRAYPPYERLGIGFQDLADPRWFEDDPRVAWGFYGHRRNLYRNTIPHDGFAILLEWGRSKPGGYFVYTSNVDGQFQKAGFDSARIMECHGSIEHCQCIGGCPGIQPAGSDAIKVDESSMRARDPLPRCGDCNSLLRPNIMMFGDWSWCRRRSEEQLDRFQGWRAELGEMKVVVIEIGAGTAIPSVRWFCGNHGKDGLVRINPRESHDATVGLDLGGLEGLRSIEARMRR